MSDLQSDTLMIKGRGYRPRNACYPLDLWTAQNPVLQRGEIGVVQDSNTFKVGDGIHSWNDLDYATGSPGPQGPIGPVGPQGPVGATGVSFSTTAIIYSESNPLPSFASTPVNTGYYYQHSNGVYDVYVHLENESDWFIIENWGGVKGPKGDTGETGQQGPQGIQGEQGIQGIQGPAGSTGPQGPAGANGANGINALSFITQSGIYSASNPLPSYASVEEGTAYLFQNADETYSLYAKAAGGSDWTVINNYGGTQGPRGETGPAGATGPYFTPSVDSAGNISWTNNGGLVNPTTQNIKGPQGPQGIQGEQGIQGATGATGPQGPQGIQGPKGDTGDQGLVITDVIVTDTTGVITIITSAVTTTVTVKNLIGGYPIAGTVVADSSNKIFTFTPTTPSDILNNSWIIKLGQ